MRKSESAILHRQISVGNRRVGHLVGGSPRSRDSEVPFYRKRICDFASGAEDFPVEDCHSVPILADNSGVYTPFSFASTQALLQGIGKPSTLSTLTIRLFLPSLLLGCSVMDVSRHVGLWGRAWRAWWSRSAACVVVVGAEPAQHVYRLTWGGDL